MEIPKGVITTFYIHHNMKKILTYFFVTLGVIFFALICGGAYIWFADPFEIRPLIEMLTADTPEVTSTLDAKASTSQVEGSAQSATVPTAVVDKNPALSPTQEAALETIGIDPASLPNSITPEMEVCFTEKLGASRVAEIKAGASPSATEIFATRSCYE
jgi:hypothetical protein